jgi:hypothetical protein
MGSSNNQQQMWDLAAQAEQAKHDLDVIELHGLEHTPHELLLAQMRVDAAKAEMQLLAVRHSLGWQVEEYREWLNARLPGSGLALLLPGGIEALPDIYAQMPGLLRQLEQLRRPSNSKQLLKHLYRYLSWYVEPSARVRWPEDLVTTAFIIVTLAFISIYVATAWSIFGMRTGLMMFSLSSLVITALNLIRQARRIRLPADRSTVERTVNQVALYKYLRTAYAPNQASPLAEDP